MHHKYDNQVYEKPLHHADGNTSTNHILIII